MVENVPICAGQIQKTSDVFKKQIYGLVKEDYSLLPEYRNAKEKATIRHNVCGHTYQVSPDNFLRGRRCRYCTRISESEKEIYDFLMDNDIDFEVEYTFDDLKNKASLRFDFMIRLNKKDFLLVEYDRVQHYVGWNSESDFNAEKIRDNMKNDYCPEKGYNLLRISYWESSIQVLGHELGKHGLITVNKIQLSLDL